MKKSQLTMIMIVGFSLFIMIGLLLYLSKSKVTGTAKSEAGKVQQSATEFKALKDYVQQCMEKTAREGIYQIGQQGGYLYEPQGGPHVDYEETDEGIMYVLHKGNKVAYNINPLRRDIGQYISSAPNYPWELFPHPQPGSSSEVFTGIFGEIKMPPLFKSQPNSIEAQLETYVETNVKKCANFESFKKQGFDISAQNPNVLATIGAKDVSFSMSYQITLTTGQGETSQFDDFSATIPARLKDTYLFSKEIIEKDTWDISFDISSPSNNNNGFSVLILRDVRENDDIIEVTDENTFIGGQQLQYVFARKNRMPALHYITNPTPRFSYGQFLARNDILSSQPVEYSDPDEDGASWKIYSPDGTELSDSSQFEFLMDEGIFTLELTDGSLKDYQEIKALRS